LVSFTVTYAASTSTEWVQDGLGSGRSMGKEQKWIVVFKGPVWSSF